MDVVKGLRISLNALINGRIEIRKEEKIKEINKKCCNGYPVLL